MCGVVGPTRRIPTAEGLRRREVVKDRQTMLNQHATGSQAAAVALVSRFLAHLAEDGVMSPSLHDVTPADAIAWLAWSGEIGNTPIHSSDCTRWGLDRTEASCSCPKRPVYGTLRKNKFILQGACSRAGMLAQWCPLRKAGNPRTASQGSAFPDLIERKLSAGGVGAR